MATKKKKKTKTLGRGRKADPELQLPLDRGKQPWERQSFESDKSFSAFVAYRGLGPARTLEKAGNIVEMGVSNLSQWSGPHRWRERVAEWDNYRDQNRLNAQLEVEREAVLEMTKRHLAMANSVQRLCAVELRRYLHKLGADVADPNYERMPQVNLKDLRELMDFAMRLERLARGEPSEVHKHTLEGKIAAIPVPNLGPDAKEKLVHAIAAANSDA